MQWRFDEEPNLVSIKYFKWVEPKITSVRVTRWNLLHFAAHWCQPNEWRQLCPAPRHTWHLFLSQSNILVFIYIQCSYQFVCLSKENTNGGNASNCLLAYQTSYHSMKLYDLKSKCGRIQAVPLQAADLLAYQIALEPGNPIFGNSIRTKKLITSQFPRFMVCLY